MKTGSLYLIPTPIADALEGQSSSAIPEQTRAAAHAITDFIAENEKSARRFLSAIRHPVRIQELSIKRFDEHSASNLIPELLRPLKEGRNVGLLSEAGCPCIADPGSPLVLAAHREGIPVVPLDGPSSILLALMASGLNGQSFWFVGYLPPSEPGRSRRIKELEAFSAANETTIVAIETPYRSVAIFDALLSALAPATLLSVSSALGSAAPSIATKPVSEWQSDKTRGALVENRPTVFSFLSRRDRRPPQGKPRRR